MGFRPVGPKRIELKADESEKKASYEDTFIKPREIASWSDALFTGFSHLKWDFTPLQLAPRVEGDTESTVRYSFDSVRKPSSIAVTVAGKVSGGSLAVQLRGVNDNMLAESMLNGESAEIRFDPSGRDQTRFVVQVVMKGVADKPGMVLAEFASIRVECDLAGE